MHRLLFTFLLLLLGAAAGHAQDAPSAFTEPPPPGPGLSDVPDAPQPEAPLPDLTGPAATRAKIAQLMIVTLEGQHTPSSADFGFLKKYPPAAAIVDQAVNAQTAQAYASKVRGVESLTGVPFWVGTNLYRLTRTRGNVDPQFLPVPSLLAVGATHDVAMATRLGRLLATHVKTMGFNFHLGPSLALAPTAPDADPVIHTLGHDAAFAAEAGAALFAAFEAEGVRALPAGFPGGGFNQRRSEPAVLSVPKEQLETRDLAPYIRLLRDNPALLHVDTTVASTLDPGGGPACLSSGIMKGLLRDALGYKGLIVAGPLDAPELSGVFDPVEAAMLALRGGADLLYWQTNPTLVTRVVDKLADAVEKGLLDRAIIDGAFERVIKTKFQQSAAAQEPAKEDKARQLTRRDDITEDILRVERQSITLLRNRNNLLPLDKADGPIGVTGVLQLDDFIAHMEKYVKKIGEQRITTAQQLGEIKDFEIDRITKRMRGLRTVVLLLTDDIEPLGAQKLVQGIRAKNVAVVVVLLGHPALAVHLAEADAIVLGYCNERAYGFTLQAVAEALMGEGAVGVRVAGQTFKVKAGESRSYNVNEILRLPAGRLPVHLGGEFPLGHSVAYQSPEALKDVVWDFGDGTGGKEPAMEHTYAAPGSYAVSLRVTDAFKNVTESSFTFVAE